MIDDLEAVRAVRRDVPAPSAAARAAARAAWDGESSALAPRAFGQPRAARRFAARTAIALVVAAAVVAAAVIVTQRRIDSVRPKHVIAIGPSTEVAPGAPEVFLLAGTDSRAFVSTPAQKQEFGDPAVTNGERSDTIVLVRVDPATHSVLAVSIPRDLVTAMAGCGTEKINAAINPDFTCGTEHGGVPLLVNTITTDLGVPINHVVEVGFVGFKTLVDQLGGIRVDFPVPTRDTYTGLNVGAGCQLLEGSQALSFVRSRHVERFTGAVWQPDGQGDLTRISDEQLALRQLAAAAIAHTGTDPRPLLRMLFDNVTVDTAFTADDALTLFNALRTQHDATTLTLPVVLTTFDGDASGLALGPDAHSVLDALAGRSALPTAGATARDSSAPPPIGSAC